MSNSGIPEGMLWYAHFRAEPVSTSYHGVAESVKIGLQKRTNNPPKSQLLLTPGIEL